MPLRMRIADLWAQVTDDGERLRRLQCVFGRHRPAAAIEMRPATGRLPDFRYTGQMECVVCEVLIGPVDEAFRARFTELFEWHEGVDDTS